MLENARKKLILFQSSLPVLSSGHSIKGFFQALNRF